MSNTCFTYCVTLISISAWYLCRSSAKVIDQSTFCVVMEPVQNLTDGFKCLWYKALTNSVQAV